MPKAEKGTPKDIANRMKSKGLQKLKFYCQMCSKQCRDENGFKCHLTSESHMRSMKLFCSNSSGMLDSFSAEFETTYLDTLYRRHRTKKCNANNIYQEMIQDKHHMHMNATKWTTLSDFVQYLGKNGKCVVEETERGWYVTFIERDPEILAQQENYKRRVESEKVEENKFQKRMEIQRMEAAKLMDRAGVGIKVEATKLDRGDTDGPIALSLLSAKDSSKKKNAKKKRLGITFGGDSDESDTEEEAARNGGKGQKMEPYSYPTSNSNSKIQTPAASMINGNDTQSRKRKSDKMLLEEKDSTADDGDSTNIQNVKASTSSRVPDRFEDVRKKNWIRRDILVRIISKKVSKGKYYKRKAIVNKVHQKYIAEVEILDSGPDENDGGDILEVDQDYLETVVPKIGKKVMILNGRGRGMLATLISSNSDKYRGNLELLDDDDGVILKKVDFDDISKAV
mmetsp:Transcript_27472/g.42085  ORF Transcript_27472/g.42085 Transcript_27472/m.42085 type:complete len:453 (+) Transcript_27472:151-1509(+)